MEPPPDDPEVDEEVSPLESLRGVADFMHGYLGEPYVPEAAAVPSPTPPRSGSEWPGTLADLNMMQVTPSRTLTDLYGNDYVAPTRPTVEMIAEYGSGPAEVMLRAQRNEQRRRSLSNFEDETVNILRSNFMAPSRESERTGFADNTLTEQPDMEIDGESPSLVTQGQLGGRALRDLVARQNTIESTEEAEGALSCLLTNDVAASQLIARNSLTAILEEYPVSEVINHLEQAGELETLAAVFRQDADDDRGNALNELLIEHLVPLANSALADAGLGLVSSSDIHLSFGNPDSYQSWLRSFLVRLTSRLPQARGWRHQGLPPARVDLVFDSIPDGIQGPQLLVGADSPLAAVFFWPRTTRAVEGQEEAPNPTRRVRLPYVRSNVIGSYILLRDVMRWTFLAMYNSMPESEE